MSANQRCSPSPPLRRPLEARFEWRVWLEKRSAELERLIAEDELAQARESSRAQDQLAFDLEEKAA
jgi:hypothetical protein